MTQAERRLYNYLKKGYCYDMIYKLINEINPNYSAIEQILTNRGIALEDIPSYLGTTEEDINPNLRFVENELIERLRQSALFNEYVEDKKISWMPNDRIIISNLLKLIMESELVLKMLIQMQK